jgi:hypothetical protein
LSFFLELPRSKNISFLWKSCIKTNHRNIRAARHFPETVRNRDKTAELAVQKFSRADAEISGKMPFWPKLVETTLKLSMVNFVRQGMEAFVA